jgi:hypothetical protein
MELVKNSCFSSVTHKVTLKTLMSFTVIVEDAIEANVIVYMCK